MQWLVPTKASAAKDNQQNGIRVMGHLAAFNFTFYMINLDFKFNIDFRTAEIIYSM